MQLLKARLNGVGCLARSDWFDLSPGLNLMHIPDAKLRQTFLRQLATLNPFPPSSCAEDFGDIPAILMQRGYPRRLNPSKRTAALALFAAAPSLIGELGKIEAVLDGVDRIEVGRRLDGSRWLNFVEIASSCRWWEIEADVAHLLEVLRQHHPALGQLGRDIANDLEPSRRIRDNLEKQLTGWVSRILEERAAVEIRPLAERLFHEITRPSRVAMAKRSVEERLPVFIDLAALLSMTEKNGSSSTDSRFYVGEKILLVDGDQAGLAAKQPDELGKRLGKLAEECQVIYAFGAIDLLRESHSTLARRTIPGLGLATFS